MAVRRYKIFFDTRRPILFLQAAVRCSICYINTNEIPSHFTFAAKSMICNHSNRDLFTCEDIIFWPKSSSGISLVFMQ